MVIQKWSESVLLITILRSSRIDDELLKVKEAASKNADCDIVIHFPFMSTISSSSVSELMQLHKSLRLCGRRLIISSVSAKTKEIFSLTGLDTFFEVVSDYKTALAKLQKAT